MPAPWLVPCGAGQGKAGRYNIIIENKNQKFSFFWQKNRAVHELELERDPHTPVNEGDEENEISYSTI